MLLAAKPRLARALPTARPCACRIYRGYSASSDEDDLAAASLAGGGAGGRARGPLSKLGKKGMGGRFTGATDGPAAKRRNRPAGRTGLRISDGSIMDESSGGSLAGQDAGSGGAPFAAGAASAAAALLPPTLPSGAAVARLSTVRCKAGKIDDTIRYYDMRIGPAYKLCSGFGAISSHVCASMSSTFPALLYHFWSTLGTAGAYLLVDRPKNEIRSFSFWGSHDELLASVEQEQYQKVAKGLLQLVNPDTLDAMTFEVGVSVEGTQLVTVNKD